MQSKTTKQGCTLVYTLASLRKCTVEKVACRFGHPLSPLADNISENVMIDNKVNGFVKERGQDVPASRSHENYAVC